jgi:hypothetical protein
MVVNVILLSDLTASFHFIHRLPLPDITTICSVFPLPDIAFIAIGDPIFICHGIYYLMLQLQNRVWHGNYNLMFQLQIRNRRS